MTSKQIDLDSLALLILRVSAGSLMLFGHGLGKLMAFSEKYTSFPDPLGVGSPISMTLAVFAEFFCSLALIAGFKTRFAAIPLFITMLTAAFVVHAGDPWQNKEMALLYGVMFLFLIIAGGGAYTLGKLFKSKT